MGDASDANLDYYGPLSEGRDDYWRKMAAPRHRMATFLALLGKHRADTVADLGCGNGLLLAEVRRRFPGAHLTGLDLSPAQIDANRARYPGLEWHAADLVDANASLDPLVGRFDAVIASEIIEHLDAPKAFLTTALALARPRGGRLLLSTQSGRVGETERRVGHRRHYTRAQMSEILRDAGWRPVRVWNTGFPFHDLSKWYANRDPDASMSQFGDSAYGWKEDLICTALRTAFRINSRRRGAQLFAVARRDA